MITLAASGAFADWKAAKAAYDNKDYATALREFKAAVEAHESYRNNAGTHWYMGKCYEALKQTSEALAAYREANRLDPTNARFAFSYSTLLVAANQNGLAADVLGKVELDGLSNAQKGYILSARARASLAAGDNRTAIEAARSATQLTPRAADAWGTLGLAYSNEGRFADAFNAFRRAWDISSEVAYGKNAVSAGINAARTASSKARKDELYRQTATVATRLAEVKGGADGALLAGEAVMAADDYNTALAWFDRSQLDTALVNYYKGQCYIGKGDVRRAESFLRNALVKQPGSKLRRNIYTSLAFVLDKQQRFDEAARAYEEAGNAGKADEMREKQRKLEQNRKADEEQRRYEELKRLQEQFKELSGGGPAPTPTPKPR